MNCYQKNKRLVSSLIKAGHEYKGLSPSGIWYDSNFQSFSRLTE